MDQYDIDMLDEKYAHGSASGGVFADNIDLGLTGPDATSQDEALARMIAQEEANPVVRAAPTRLDVQEFQQEYKHDQPAIALIESSQRQRGEQLRAEKMEQRERDRAQRLQRDLDRERMQHHQERREREQNLDRERVRDRALRSYSYSPYLDKERLIDWGINLLPYGYSTYEAPLRRFITQRVLDRLDEAEIERRVRQYIADLETKKPRAPRVSRQSARRQPARRSARKQPARKASAKKSAKRKSAKRKSVK